MALRRRTGARFESNAWAGFVDAMTALLLIMIFILSVFMIMQYFLRETIGRQAGELEGLASQLSELSEVLGATQKERDELQTEADSREAKIGELEFELQARSEEIASFEEQLASLIARNTALTSENDKLQTEIEDAKASSKVEQLQLALAAAREELDTEKELARKAAAEADALEAMIDSLKSDVTTGAEGLNEEMQASIAQVMALASVSSLDENLANTAQGQELKSQLEELTELERKQMANQMAVEFIRDKLKHSDDELNALTLALEEERQNAEDTLTLLAALEKQEGELNAAEMSEAEKNAALLEVARQKIAAHEAIDEASARKIALLNQQTADLRAQLTTLNSLVDAQIQADGETQVQVEALGQKLNAALARVAATQKSRADELEKYRSDFFGKLREVLADVPGVEIVGDRFVFSSEVLFAPGSSELSEEGFLQIGQISELINNLSSEIPSEINWILRVDGHTDITPITNSHYRDNWELSQARALSVVRLMVDLYGVSPNRLAAAGFGEFQPIDTGASPEALARNRRIELKLTEK